MPQSQHKVVISHPGPPDVLQLIEAPIPEPAAGEIRVRVHYSGVAFGDVLKRRKLIPGMPKIPYTPGYDAAGVVEAVGAGVQRISVGQRVTGFVLNGGNAEHVVAPAERFVPVPDGVAMDAAACLPLNYVTAFQMLHRMASAGAGQTVLVHGAAGGVGTALLQLARLAGVTAYGTASRGKHDVVRDHGGIPIDYRSEDFVARIRSETGGKGVDAVFDAIGGAHLKRSRGALARGGTLVVYGASTANEQGSRAFLTTFALIGLYKLLPGADARFYGISSGGVSTTATIQEDLQALVELLGAGKIQPVIGAVLPLGQAAEAHRMIERAAVSGKILLDSAP